MEMSLFSQSLVLTTRPMTTKRKHKHTGLDLSVRIVHSDYLMSLG